MKPPRCPGCGGRSPGDEALSSLCAACLLKTASPPSDAPTLDRGCDMGPYEIVALVGQGGMGQVYRARDTRLPREVAIKVMSARLLPDARARQRLLREARVIAGLKHPHICALHDIGEQDGMMFLVLEYLEGETLAHRLARGPMPLSDVLRYATEIAGALASAHLLGVTHRDLKPSNVMLTREGAKLLDFGLARLHAADALAPLSSAAAGVPRAGETLSCDGALVGTLQYMAPEQLRGHDADPRCDIFAFGLLVYEMITGGRPFAGATREELIASVLSSEPEPISARRPDAPWPLQALVLQCLAKDRGERWQNARDLSLHLRSILDEPLRSSARPPARRRGRRMGGLAAALATAIMALSAGPWHGAWGADPEPLRFTVAPPQPPGAVASPRGISAVSPDGRRLAWSVSNGQGRTSLAIQELASTEVTHLSGTLGAWAPFWSPDSRQVAFFADGMLKRIDLAAGTVEVLAPAPSGQGGTWSARAGIVFAPDRTGVLYRIAAIGASAVAITALDPARGDTGHQAPYFLPDGKRFTYFVSSARSGAQGIVVGDIDGRPNRWLASADTGAVYAWPGYLLFARGTTLLAARFELASETVVGDPIVLQKGIHVSRGLGMPYISMSATGVLVFHTRHFPKSELVWVDRRGQSRQPAFPPATYRDPALSADGVSVAAHQLDPNDQTLKIWLLDTARRTSSLLTSNFRRSAFAVWSPDGQELAFAANGTPSSALYRMPFRGGPEQLIVQASGNLQPTDWSRDGRLILYGNTGLDLASDIWTVSADGKSPPVAFLRTRFTEEQGRFSPDGRWVAYSSNESGRFEVYLRAFPDSGPHWQLSTDGGSQPYWRGDGRELFYLSPTRHVVSVPIGHAGAAVRPGAATALFELPRGEILDSRNSFGVTPDGERFLLNVEAPDNPRSPMLATVVVNWLPIIDRSSQ